MAAFRTEIDTRINREAADNFRKKYNRAEIEVMDQMSRKADYSPVSTKHKSDCIEIKFKDGEHFRIALDGTTTKIA